jgi:hypothetical protein
MVGKRVAVFTSLEVKREKGGRESDQQKNWKSVVAENGGIAIVARSEDEAMQAIQATPGA